jgi:hypothetical protein
MNRRVATAAAFAVILLLATIALAIGGTTTQPTPTTSTAQPLPTTSTTTGQVVSTGRGPSAFTTITSPGPVVPLVHRVTCVGYVGDGYQVTYSITNHGPAVVGTLAGKVDDSDPTILAPALPLARGARLEATATVRGSGDSVVITYAIGATGGGASSFPVETPGCPTDPADERAAEQATTTSGAGP